MNEVVSFFVGQLVASCLLHLENSRNHRGSELLRRVWVTVSAPGSRCHSATQPLRLAEGDGLARLKGFSGKAEQCASESLSQDVGVSEIGGALFGAFFTWILVFWGMFWGTPIFGNPHVARHSRSAEPCISVTRVYLRAMDSTDTACELQPPWSCQDIWLQIKLGFRV